MAHEAISTTSLEENYPWAVKTGDIEYVKELVTKKKELVSYKDNKGRSPIHWAADFGQVEILNFLIILPSSEVQLNGKAQWNASFE